jgi:hypothetical protein
MALTTGSKVGTDEILGPIGAGGMGEVYLQLESDRTAKALPQAC